LPGETTCDRRLAALDLPQFHVLATRPAIDSSPLSRFTPYRMDVEADRLNNVVPGPPDRPLLPELLMHPGLKGWAE
jgi:hypothetical protein